MELQDPLKRIEQKLERLSRSGPKVRVADATYDGLGPPWSEKDVEQFQRDNGFTLPEGYALFLTTIGNGGPGPDGGLWKLPHHLEKDHRDRALAPFAYTAAPVHYPTRQANDRFGLPSVDVRDGTLPLTDIDGDYVLVLNGKQRGTVWWDAPHGYSKGRYPIRPVVAKDGSQATFLVWYEEWLDGALGP
ncbi:MAG: hypothetical protein U0790_03795 [Isosphaeraceae bacterium]